MILADEITCNVSQTDEMQIGCQLPDPSYLEHLTAYGTVGAAVVAAILGGWSAVEAVRLRKSTEQARVEARLEKYGNRIIDALDPLSDLSTANIDQVRVNLQKTIKPFLDVLGYETPAKKEFGDRLSMFVLQVLRYMETMELAPAENPIGGVFHRMIAANAQGATRVGVHGMCYARHEGRRTEVLAQFASSTTSIETDIEALLQKGIR